MSGDQYSGLFAMIRTTMEDCHSRLTMVPILNMVQTKIDAYLSSISIKTADNVLKMTDAVLGDRIETIMKKTLRKISKNARKEQQGPKIKIKRKP
jgi:ABC-type lipoprotein release transport system permease subunit